MILNLLIVFFSAIGILSLLDLSVFIGCYIACGFKVPNREQYFDNAPRILIGLLLGVGAYCSIVMMCLL